MKNSGPKNPEQITQGRITLARTAREWTAQRRTTKDTKAVPPIDRLRSDCTQLVRATAGPYRVIRIPIPRPDLKLDKAIRVALTVTVLRPQILPSAQVKVSGSLLAKDQDQDQDQT